MQNLKLFIVVNVDWAFLTHRLPIGLKAKEEGYDVYIVARDTGKFDVIRSHGLTPINIEVDRSGTNFLKELLVIKQLTKIYREHKPDVVHHVTLKMSIYASIAARLAKVPLVINAISGMGYMFTDERKSLVRSVALQLMKFAFKNRGQKFIFQNDDDIGIFKSLGLFKGNKLFLIKGCGADLDQFENSSFPTTPKVRFILTARMLKDKGITEFVEAAKIVEKNIPNSGEWVLVGAIDPQNPAAYSEEELLNLIKDSPVEWLGYRSDIDKLLINSHVMVLPSYREGLPKSLVEACAAGRPIITTSAVGCRDCVEDGVNGFIVPIRDIELMAEKMELLIAEEDLRIRMGKASREKAEKEFSLDLIVSQSLELYVD